MIDISYLRPQSPSRFLRACKVGAVLLAGLPISASFGATFTWGNLDGNFTDPNRWVGGVAPLGTDPTDVLVFGGDVSTQFYTATLDSATSPFLVNRLDFTATNPFLGSGFPQTIAGSDATKTIKLGGLNPQILQSGTATILIKTGIRLGGNLTISGAGAGTLSDQNRITVDGPISGTADITKAGTFTFRFGSDAAILNPYSLNTWVGGLTLTGGSIRFNNNAHTAPTALRGNPVTLSTGTLITTQFRRVGLDPESSLRMGTLNGTGGTVEGRRETTTVGEFDSIDIVIATLDSGTFGGTVNNGLTGSGDNDGQLTVRGVGTQTFTGTLTLSKDVKVGRGAGITLAGGTTLAGQTTNAAIVLNGGTFTLDNTTVNSNNRLRDGSTTSTGLEPIGGGVFSLIGNALEPPKPSDAFNWDRSPAPRRRRVLAL
jgi:hypothetical protein